MLFQELPHFALTTLQIQRAAEYYNAQGYYPQVITKPSNLQTITGSDNRKAFSAGYKSMKEWSPEPAHNSQPVGELSKSLTDRFFP